jgi:beta-glucuronidase
MKIALKLILLLLIACSSHAQQNKKISLNGEWSIALDPVKVGEKQRWQAKEFNPRGWDKVTVPHSFTVDSRFHKFTGDVWYIKKFNHTAVPANHRAVLHFEAVFYKAEVWLNGTKAGAHEGGYTPFEIDVTDLLISENTLSLKVNNAWDTTTIPGSKTQVDYEGSSSSQVYPWMNYGGITRDVTLIIRPELYVENVKAVAVPLKGGKSGRLELKIRVNNSGKTVAKGQRPILNLWRLDKKVPLKYKFTEVDVVPEKRHVFKTEITVDNIQLWSFDDPALYRLEVIVGKDTCRHNIGFRSFEVSGTKLLLNGEAIRMGGCNRPMDYPGYGSIDPFPMLEKDLNMIKSGGMELSRISHYPVTRELLDWADKHGMLLILEAGNWQLTPKQMSDPAIQEKFRQQFVEMMERDWNHPSVVAWSVGNEYQSQTPEGKAWTKSMTEFSKSMDPSRLVTFSSMFVNRDIIRKPEDEASQYVDFISANIYGNYLKSVQHIHEVYPDKPVYISEFGIRADFVADESVRVQHLKNAMDDFRKCDYVVGASIWTFNDYQSMFPGTNKDGYRHWGLVNAAREPREMYFTWQEEMSPLTITVQRSPSSFQVTATVRVDLPSYTVKNYELRVNGKSHSLGVLKPGESKRITVPPLEGETVLEVVKPGGFVILRKIEK